VSFTESEHCLQRLLANCPTVKIPAEKAWRWLSEGLSDLSDLLRWSDRNCDQPMQQ
jgi:hypothetical protein